jgi:hypothetical protein
MKRCFYRNDIRDLVANIVSQALPQAPAGERIIEYSARMPEADRAKFIGEDVPVNFSDV